MSKAHVTQGSLIARKREARGWSQSELGMFVGVGRSTVSLWESKRRRPSRAAIKILASLFGIDGDAIFDDYPSRKAAA